MQMMMMGREMSKTQAGLAGWRAGKSGRRLYRGHPTGAVVEEETLSMAMVVTVRHRGMGGRCQGCGVSLRRGRVVEAGMGLQLEAGVGLDRQRRRLTSGRGCCGPCRA